MEHWFTTGVCVWFHLLGFQAFVLWQLTQFAAVGIWFAVLPVAALPLWQVEHTVAAVNKLWSGFEPNQVLVDLWQLSQLPVTEACIGVAGLPVAP